jgi:hypothetical protein
MTKKAIALLLVAAGLAGGYAWFGASWLRPSPIRIMYSTRPNPELRHAPGVAPVVFGLDQDYRLTSLKVIRLADLQAGAATSPLWHLVRDPDPRNQPASLGSLIYGQRVPGLRPAPGLDPPAQPLEPNQAYRLLLEAGRARGQIDFQVPALGR